MLPDVLNATTDVLISEILMEEYVELAAATDAKARAVYLGWLAACWRLAMLRKDADV